jgi:hypothetical protein
LITPRWRGAWRIYLEQGFLRFERKTQASGKEGVGPVLAFDPERHAFWRIRHSVTSDERVFETSARVHGSPGSWIEHARSPRAFAITGVKVELKAGTWQSEATAPGELRQREGGAVMRARLLAAFAVCFLLSTSTASAQHEVVEYYALDTIGSVRVVFDQNGAITSRRDYEPFGAPLVQISLDPKIYAGLFHDDESGLE